MTVRHALKQQPRPSRSTDAPPEFSVQEEPFFQLVDELPPLFSRYAELAKAPVDIDWQGLMNLALAGQLKVVTARYGDALVGFCISILSRPLMYKSTLYG